jgi:nuclear pore complex protein Nup133
MCYIFKCPPSTQRTTPHHILIPHSLNREPGLVLISVDGEIRFWDSIGIGLAGGDHYSTTRLNLNADELITFVARRDVSLVSSTIFQNMFYRFTIGANFCSVFIHRPFVPTRPDLFWRQTAYFIPHVCNAPARNHFL